MLPSRIDGIYPRPIAFGLGHGAYVWFDLIPCVSTKRCEKSMLQNEKHVEHIWTQHIAWNKATPADPQTKNLLM